MSGTDGTPIENSSATETASSYEVCQRTGFRVLRGRLVREWTGLWVREDVWEPRHPLELLRMQAIEKPHEPGNPEPDDLFIGSTVTVDDL